MEIGASATDVADMLGKDCKTVEISAENKDSEDTEEAVADQYQLHKMVNWVSDFLRLEPLIVLLV